MAQAIIGALRQREPRLQIAFTFFSPSAERMAARVGADVAGYLPWDRAADSRLALNALRPSVIAYVRTEVWPVLSREAARLRVRQAMVNAILPEGSSRLGMASRFMLGPAYRRLQAIGAVTDAHARRFPGLGVPAERVRATGDARFDQVVARVRAGAANRDLLQRLRDPETPTIVAGSTWGADEAPLLRAFAALRRQRRARLIIAPHEPDEAHLKPLESRLTNYRLRHSRLSEIETAVEELPDVVVVDRVGVLADLYAIGQIAYVGGGFHPAGLHSIVEPAAHAVPVIFGPRHANAREAAEMRDFGGAIEVGGGDDLQRALQELVAAPDVARRVGSAALAYVESQLGGATRNAELILELLRQR